MRAFTFIPVLLLALAAGCAGKPPIAPPKPQPNGADVSAPFEDRSIYEAKAGDTLMSIARQYYGDESRWRSIYNANRERLRAPDDLKPGMKILLPPKDLPPYIEYTVQPGDTLSQLALRFYGDKAMAKIIAEENAMADPDALNVGQVLKIPILK